VSIDRDTTRPSLKEVRRIIADQYHLFPPATIAELCGRSVGYIRCLASAMGFKSVGRGRGHSPYFTPLEIKTLKLEFGVTPLAVLARRMNRTEAALAAKCSRLGLGRRRCAPWSESDDAFIWAHYPLRGSEIASDLGRSKGAVRHRARKLGVRSVRVHPWKAEISQLWEEKRARRA